MPSHSPRCATARVHLHPFQCYPMLDSQQLSTGSSAAIAGTTGGEVAVIFSDAANSFSDDIVVPLASPLLLRDAARRHSAARRRARRLRRCSRMASIITLPVRSGCGSSAAPCRPLRLPLATHARSTPCKRSAGASARPSRASSLSGCEHE